MSLFALSSCGSREQHLSPTNLRLQHFRRECNEYRDASARYVEYDRRRWYCCVTAILRRREGQALRSSLALGNPFRRLRPLHLTNKESKTLCIPNVCSPVRL